MIFFSLCKFFDKILVVHRMKLGGRYHLIISALQGLLRCLFISYKNEASVSFGTMSEPFALGEAHAVAYGCLLATICDPTVSAVTRLRKRSRHELNDETKKARSIAGQHLQYLIMEFCECQLQGRLKPEVKAALTPGLYAIFSVMSPDVMRTINAAMNSSSQSIFKALYEDYGRSRRSRGI
jgi:nucleolar pre-ribosomal-associated protein 2